MSKLITIKQQTIGDDKINAVLARDLHKFLECTERFSAWFERMCQYGFEEQQDFTGVKSFTVVNNGAEKPLDDFMISIDMAKEISMLQRSDKGKEARKYFIECEKQLKDLTPKFANMSPQLQLLIQMEQQQNEIKATLDFQAEQLKSVEHKLSQTDCSNNYYAITGFANLHGINVDDKTANKAGRKASKLCRERGIKIGDCGSTKFGKIGAYPEEILHEVFDILDI